MKKIISFIIMLSVLISSLGMFACKNNNSNDVQPSSYEETDIYLVQNGASNYSIVIPKDAEDHVSFVASDFQELFNKATGFTLPIITDDEAVSLNNYISIGKTTLAEKNKITISNKYSVEAGYRIELKDGNVFLYGYDCYGTANAVYDFLQFQFNYRFYAADEIYIDNVETAKLINIEREYSPSLFRHKMINAAAASPEMALRYHTVAEIAPNDLPLGYPHSHFYFLPPADYQADHPEWYDVKSTTASAGAICLTADGIAEQMAANIIALFDETGYREGMLGQEDTWDRCNCATCQASDAKYTQSGTNLAFCIKVIEEMKKLYAEQGRPDFDFHMVLLAYYQNEPAPVSVVDGKMELVDPALKADDHLGVLLCLFNTDATAPMSSEKSANAIFEIKGWSYISKDIRLWLYRGYFPAYEMMFINDWAYIKDQISTMLQYNVTELRYSDVPFSMFDEMYGFVASQLAYNLDLNANDLIKEFISAYYKDAAPIVQQWFDEITAHLNYRKAYYTAQNIDFGTYCLKGASAKLFDQANWPQELFLNWIKLFDTANETLENCSLSKVDKEIVIQRLKKLSIFPTYWNLKMYKSSFDINDWKVKANETIKLAYSLGYDPEYLTLE